MPTTIQPNDPQRVDGQLPEGILSRIVVHNGEIVTDADDVVWNESGLEDDPAPCASGGRDLILKRPARILLEILDSASSPLTYQDVLRMHRARFSRLGSGDRGTLAGHGKTLIEHGLAERPTKHGLLITEPGRRCLQAVRAREAEQHSA